MPTDERKQENLKRFEEVLGKALGSYNPVSHHERFAAQNRVLEQLLLISATASCFWTYGDDFHRLFEAAWKKADALAGDTGAEA